MGRRYKVVVTIDTDDEGVNGLTIKEALSRFRAGQRWDIVEYGFSQEPKS